ncbi:hypothetical protein M1349_04190 [Patescibacteria group bacterium]|nr:hypothetical protein [Patescibacteria group bacterium]
MYYPAITMHERQIIGNEAKTTTPKDAGMTRRKFLTYSGFAVAGLLVFGGTGQMERAEDTRKRALQTYEASHPHPSAEEIDSAKNTLRELNREINKLKDNRDYAGIHEATAPGNLLVENEAVDVLAMEKDFQKSFTKEFAKKNSVALARRNYGLAAAVSGAVIFFAPLWSGLGMLEEE